MRFTPVARVARVTVVLAVGAALFMVGSVPVTASAASTTPKLKRWVTTTQLKTGTVAGAAVASGSVTISKPVGKVTYAGKAFDYATWTSPWSTTTIAADQVIPSWTATTPAGTVVKIEMRVKTTGGKTGSWDTVSWWASDLSTIKRTSASAQTDDYARVDTDTVIARSGTKLGAWQVRAVLMRKAGTKITPVLRSVGAVASASRSVPSVSRTTMTKTVELAVPKYSQMIHTKEYRQYNGGGAAWCSPTSTTMVLRYYRSGPTAADYAWVNKAYPDRFVAHAARATYDEGYSATGNWAFNTAYAGSFGLDTYVTRMKDLRDAEKLITKGVPVVASIKFSRGGLKGSPLTSTGGHLVVIVGFEKSGRVIVNDPAAPKNSTVRRVYDRAQFERAWISGSNATAYVIQR